MQDKRGNQNRTPAHLDDHHSIYKLVAENVNGLSKRPISYEVALCGNVDQVCMVQIKTERRHCQCVSLFLKMAPQAPPFAPGSAIVQHTPWAIWSLDARVGVAYRGRRGKERPNAWQIGDQAGQPSGAEAFWNNAGGANGKRTVDQDEQEVLVRQPPSVAQPDSATGASTKYQHLQIVYY